MKKSKRSFRVLIVDDCPDDISRPYMLTSQLGCEVALALDGRQALSSIITSKFDLVILDWNMPVMSGSDFLLSAREQGVGLNVVVHSGSRLSREELDAASDYGVVDFWPKPMGPVEILKRIKTIRERLGR